MTTKATKPATKHPLVSEPCKHGLARIRCKECSRPAAWAMKAALRIQQQFFPHTRIPLQVRTELAAIIEQESPVGKMADVLKRLLKANQSLMPGLVYIAVQDYALINEAPIEAERVLREIV